MSIQTEYDLYTTNGWEYQKNGQFTGKTYQAFTTQGKNLANIDLGLNTVLTKNIDVYNLYPTETNRFGGIFNVLLQSNTNYTFSVEILEGYTDTSINPNNNYLTVSMFYNNVWTSVIGWQWASVGNKTYIFNRPYDVTAIRFILANGDTNAYCIFKNFQIRQGSYTAETMPPYEPYYPSVQTKDNILDNVNNIAFSLLGADFTYTELLLFLIVVMLFFIIKGGL